MVTSGAIYARIDRPAKTISFSKSKDANDVLNEWSGNIHNLLGLCEKLGHLITKVCISPSSLPFPNLSPTSSSPPFRSFLILRSLR